MGRSANLLRRTGATVLALTVALAGGVGLTGSVEPMFDQHPNALWRVVHDVCVVDRRLFGLSAPCLAVSLRGGWAVVKDVGTRSHLLLVPLRRVSGIEDPKLVAPDAPNDWAPAWAARRYVERLWRREIPRQDIVLVVNSRYGRTQDQLHIHIDCVAPDAAMALAANLGRIGAAWTPAPALGPGYEARRLAGEDLTGDPFRLLSRGDPSARADMGAYALAVVGAVFENGEPGFILLAHRADLARGDPGSGEALLDHSCQILRAG